MAVTSKVLGEKFERSAFVAKKKEFRPFVFKKYWLLHLTVHCSLLVVHC
jgi:hypothetical protein